MQRGNTETYHAADHKIAKNSSSSYSNEADWYDVHTNKQLLTLQPDELEIITAAETDGSAAEPARYEALFSPGVVRKRCHWFDDKPEDVNSAMASSSPRDKRSGVVSPKQIYGRLRSSSSVRSFKDEEPEFDYPSRNSSTAPRAAPSTLIPICLPPGCIPSEVIVQVPGSATPPEARSIVTLDPQWEVKSWMSDIYDQVLSMDNPAQPGLVSAPFSSASIVVHDLGEDVSLENNDHSNAALRMFLQNHKVVHRRNAICKELEMNTGFVKINGAKFSLWHLRAELQKTIKFSNL